MGWNTLQLLIPKRQEDIGPTGNPLENKRRPPGFSTSHNSFSRLPPGE